MDGSIAAQWTGIAILGIAQLVTFVRMGRRSSDIGRSSSRKSGEEHGASETEFTNMKRELIELKNYVKSEDHGLPSIKAEMSAFRENCARISSKHGAEIGGLEKRVDIIDGRRS